MLGILFDCIFSTGTDHWYLLYHDNSHMDDGLVRKIFKGKLELARLSLINQHTRLICGM